MDNTKLKITKQYAEEFDKKCAQINAHGFLRFLTETDDQDVSILDLIEQLGRSISVSSHKKEKEIDLTEKEIKDIIKEFYGRFPRLKEDVEKILDNTHPNFIDENGNSTIHIERQKGGEVSTGSVVHSGRHEYLNLELYLNGSVNDLTTIAHELAHAVSAHHTKKIEAVKENIPQEEFDKLTHSSFARDCIVEIESHIIERLFNRFLMKKGILNEEDVKAYENGELISLLNEINLIREELDIIKQLPCPITEKSLTELVDKLNRDKNFRRIEGLKTMHDTNKNSKHMFRYVVGRVVSSVWIKRYEECSTKEEKRKMLTTFENYLSKTHKLDLDSACKKLLGQDFTAAVEDYCLGTLNERKV